MPKRRASRTVGHRYASGSIRFERTGICEMWLNAQLLAFPFAESVMQEGLLKIGFSGLVWLNCGVCPRVKRSALWKQFAVGLLHSRRGRR